MVIPWRIVFMGTSKYEGLTMLPMIESFIKKYELDDFVGGCRLRIMNNDNITCLETKDINIL